MQEWTRSDESLRELTGEPAPKMDGTKDLLIEGLKSCRMMKDFLTKERDELKVEVDALRCLLATEDEKEAAKEAIMEETNTLRIHFKIEEFIFFSTIIKEGYDIGS